MALDKESLLRQQGLGSKKKIVSEEIQIVRKKIYFKILNT